MVELAGGGSVISGASPSSSNYLSGCECMIIALEQRKLPVQRGDFRTSANNCRLALGNGFRTLSVSLENIDMEPFKGVLVIVFATVSPRSFVSVYWRTDVHTAIMLGAVGNILSW